MMEHKSVSFLRFCRASLLPTHHAAQLCSSRRRCWGHFRKGRGTTQPLLHFKDFLRKYPQRRPIETVELPPEGEIESLYMVGRCAEEGDFLNSCC